MNTVVFQFFGHALGQAGERGLAGAVGRKAGKFGGALKSAHAADMDDVRGTAVFQQGDQCPGDFNRREYVCFKRLLPYLVGGFLKRAINQYGGIVDEDIQFV